MSQVIVNTLISASVYGLIALSFSLIYGTTRFFHIAHGAVYVVGAYASLAAIKYMNWAACGVWGTIGAVLVAIAASAGLGGLLECGIYRPLRRKRATPMVLLIASLGMYIVIQNLISAFFGDDAKTIRTWPVVEGLPIFGAHVTQIQILIIAVAALLFIVTILVLRYTKAGIALRALASNPSLALVIGMDTDRIILNGFLIGSALVGAAGVLISLDIDMTPTMGMNALLMGVVAAIIGGIGSIPGIAIGSLVLALAQHLGVWKIPTQWQDAIAFAILLLFLMLRPQGVFGKGVKKARL